MSDYHLTLYDFIVDVVPGLTVLGLCIFLFPEHPIVQQLPDYGNLAAGAFAVVGGYLVGRVIHGVGGWWPIEDGARWVVTWIPFARARTEYLSFERRLRSVLERGAAGTLEYELADAVARDLQREFHLPREALTQPLPNRRRSRNSEDTHDLVYARYLADSLLYGRGNLSWKYALLATFFRNSWLVLLLFGILFLFRPLLTDVDGFSSLGMQTWGPALDWSFGIVLLVASAACFAFWFTFQRRESRATITELYYRLPEVQRRE